VFTDVNVEKHWGCISGAVAAYRGSWVD
jgi:hypothetical protein